MKRIQMTMAALAMLAAGMVSAGQYDSWGYHASIQFNGYNKSETLTNFPALVALGTNISGFAYSQFQSGSNDLAFTDATGTTNLNYEIDTWNPNGLSYVWVQVPALASNSTITVWWGALGQTQPVCTTNGSVWGSQYYGVWHLGQASGNLLDSTTNGNTGLPESSPVQGTNGVVGNAVSLNGSSSYIATTVSVPDPQVFTESIWFKTTVAQGRLMGLGNAQTGQSSSYDRMMYLSSAGQVYFGRLLQNPLRFAGRGTYHARHR